MEGGAGGGLRSAIPAATENTSCCAKVAFACTRRLYPGVSLAYQKNAAGAACLGREMANNAENHLHGAKAETCAACFHISAKCAISGEKYLAANYQTAATCAFASAEVALKRHSGATAKKKLICFWRKKSCQKAMC
jgi:hypothetical protein